MTARHYLRLADLIGGQGTARPIDLPDGIRCRTSPEGRVIVGPVQVVVAPVQSPRISTRR
jgi:hypothetical protein